MGVKPTISALLLFTLALFASCAKDSNTSNDPRPIEPVPFKDDLTPQPNPYRLKAYSNKPTSMCGGYYEALPPGYDNTTDTFPLLLALHGGGEYGNGDSIQLENILGNSVAMRVANKSLPVVFNHSGEEYSFVVILPQFYNKPEPHHIKQLFDYVIQHYRIDTTRLYLTGLSAGGGSTWEFAGSEYGDMLAAIVPICSQTDFSTHPGSIDQFVANDIPAWTFHNDNDHIVAAGITRKIAGDINLKDPKRPVRLTIWPDGYHDAWTKASSPNYREDGKNIYEWMLQFVRN